MEYIAFVFGIFGLMAYLQLSSLKNRMTALEDQLARISGTPQAEDRAALRKAAMEYAGKPVISEQKEDQQDVDVMMYGNSRYGSNTILDVDGEWMLLHVCTPKGEKDKLIRLGSIQRISLTKE